VPLPERAKAAVLAVVVILSAIGLILAAQAFRPQASAPSQGIRLSMTIQSPGWTLTYENNDTRNNTAFLFLLEAASVLHFRVEWTNWSPPFSAVFVDAINGARNGDGGRWWQFWVDGVYADTAADLTVLHGGDSVLWRFATPEGG